MNERESEWQTREHSCEQEAREKSLAVIDRPKGKGQCAKVRERRAQQTMQIYLSVQYGTESNWRSTDWPPPTYWPLDTLRRLMPLTVATGRCHWLTFTLLRHSPFFVLTLISVSIKRRLHCCCCCCCCQRHNSALHCCWCCHNSIAQRSVSATATVCLTETCPLSPR